MALVFVVSCNSNDSYEAEDEYGDSGQLVSSVSVFTQQHNAAQGIDVELNDDFIITDGFTEGDKLYISQMGPSTDPNFVDKNLPLPYLYIYEYKKDADEEANWNSGYNFSCQKDRFPIDWDDVKNVGSVGNAFSMYAMFFPGDNEPRVKEDDGKVLFNVEKDQTGGKEDVYDKQNFIKSDIMGAYHATSSLYTRLRFRLFHLTTYLRVTLYVPVFRSSGDDMKFSGYEPGAVKGAFVMNAMTDFSIEWRANRSSDTEAPLVQQLSNAERSDIRMYMHKPTEEISEIKVNGYYKDSDVNEDEDEVRVYNFSVLFPTQTFGDNFLCFVLESPDDDSYKYYYFSASQIVGDSGNYGLTQGTLQQLFLYLPRRTNETILVGAKILPWKDAVTDMTVTKKSSGTPDSGN